MLPVCSSFRKTTRKAREENTKFGLKMTNFYLFSSSLNISEFVLCSSSLPFRYKGTPICLSRSRCRYIYTYQEICQHGMSRKLSSIVLLKKRKVKSINQ